MRNFSLFLVFFFTSFSVFATDLDENSIEKVVVKRCEFSESDVLDVHLKNKELPISFYRKGQKKMIFSVLIGELSPQEVSNFTSMICKSFYYEEKTQVLETPFDFLERFKKPAEKIRFIDIETEKIIAEKIGYKTNDGTNYYYEILKNLHDEIFEAGEKYIDFSFLNKRKNYSSLTHVSQITHVSRENGQLSIAYRTARMRSFDFKSHTFGIAPCFDRTEEKCFAVGVPAEIIKNILIGKKSYQHYDKILSSFISGYTKNLEDFLSISPGMEEPRSDKMEVLVDEAIKQKLEEKISMEN